MDRFPIEQWFDVSKHIDKSDIENCENQMMLYAVKDGLDIESKEFKSAYKKHCHELRKAVSEHNKIKDTELSSLVLPTIKSIVTGKTDNSFTYHELYKAFGLDGLDKHVHTRSVTCIRKCIDELWENLVVIRKSRKSHTLFLAG